MITLLFLSTICCLSISLLSDDREAQLTMRLHLLARCSSFRSFDCPCLIDSLTARRAGQVIRAISIEVILNFTLIVQGAFVNEDLMACSEYPCCIGRVRFPELDAVGNFRGSRSAAGIILSERRGGAIRKQSANQVS